MFRIFQQKSNLTTGTIFLTIAVIGDKTYKKKVRTNDPKTFPWIRKGTKQIIKMMSKNIVYNKYDNNEKISWTMCNMKYVKMIM